MHSNTMMITLHFQYLVQMSQSFNAPAVCGSLARDTMRLCWQTSDWAGLHISETTAMAGSVYSLGDYFSRY